MPARTHAAALALVLALAAPAPAQTPDPAAVAPTPPERIANFVVAEREVLQEPGAGTFYRYRAGDEVMDVFVYPVGTGGQGAESTLEGEAAAFRQVLELGPRQGWYDTYRIAWDKPAPFAGLPGRSIAYVMRRGDEVFVSFYYLYELNGHFVKARCTVPEARFAKSHAPGFAEALASALAPQAGAPAQRPS